MALCLATLMQLLTRIPITARAAGHLLFELTALPADPHSILFQHVLLESPFIPFPIIPPYFLFHFAYHIFAIAAIRNLDYFCQPGGICQKRFRLLTFQFHLVEMKLLPLDNPLRALKSLLLEYCFRICTKHSPAAFLLWYSSAIIFKSSS